MVPELEKPRVTEIQVRMDCNGCVQKIKKALHGINGIYDLYIDFPQQKLTIIGWADPEKIVKAIRKTRKIATICSHTEVPEPSNQETGEQAHPEGAPAADAPAAPSNDPANPPPPDTPPAEAAQQPAEPPKDPPPPPPDNPAPPENPPPPENPQPEVKPTPIANDTNGHNQPGGSSGQKDMGEVHVIHHHPPDYGYRYGYGYGPGQWNRYPNGQGIQHEAPPPPQPVYVTQTQPSYMTQSQPVYVTASQPSYATPSQPSYVTHSYNTYRPSPYVTEYEHIRPSSPPRYTQYSRMDNYNENYHNNTVYQSNGYGNGNGNITSIFSDENPNACRVM